MKKVILYISIFILSLFLIFTIAGYSFAATEVSYIPTLEGVRIRKASEEHPKQGFKFTASVSEDVNFATDEDILEHGFFIAKGTYSYEQLTTAINNGETRITETAENVYDGETAKTSNIVTVRVKGTGNKFSITLVGLEDEDEDM